MNFEELIRAAKGLTNQVIIIVVVAGTNGLFQIPAEPISPVPLRTAPPMPPLPPGLKLNLQLPSGTNDSYANHRARIERMMATGQRRSE